jgi:hypothetical protein
MLNDSNGREEEQEQEQEQEHEDGSEIDEEMHVRVSRSNHGRFRQKTS